MEQLKAKAKNDCLCESYYHSQKKLFIKGRHYVVKANPVRTDNGLTVYLHGLPMCDVGSSFFEENFELIK